jgi:hypothetical protein
MYIDFDLAYVSLNIAKCGAYTMDNQEHITC